jgi:hypothetical protein
VTSSWRSHSFIISTLVVHLLLYQSPARFQPQPAVRSAPTKTPSTAEHALAGVVPGSVAATYRGASDAHREGIAVARCSFASLIRRASNHASSCACTQVAGGGAACILCQHDVIRWISSDRTAVQQSCMSPTRCQWPVRDDTGVCSVHRMPTPFPSPAAVPPSPARCPPCTPGLA